MSSINAPFGMRPANSEIGMLRPRGYFAIASGTAGAIYQNDPVTIDISTNVGRVKIATVGGAIIGVFQGVEYVDVTGKPTYSNFWPAAQATFGALDAKAYCTREPRMIYEIQANGSITQAMIGNQGNFAAIGVGSFVNISTATLDTTTIVSSASNKQLRILGLSPGVDNSFGDAFTIVHVEISNHLDVATVNAY